MSANVIATKNFTTSGPPVTMVGLGGEGILRTHKRDAQAREVIKTAVKQGVTYFDCARVYADSEVYYGSLWREHPKTRSGIFQAANQPGGIKTVRWQTLKRPLSGWGPIILICGKSTMSAQTMILRRFRVPEVLWKHSLRPNQPEKSVI